MIDFFCFCIITSSTAVIYSSTPVLFLPSTTVIHLSVTLLFCVSHFSSVLVVSSVCSPMYSMSLFMVSSLFVSYWSVIILPSMYVKTISPEFFMHSLIAVLHLLLQMDGQYQSLSF